jgi:hypothetical protein
VDRNVTSRTERSSGMHLVDLRRALGALTQAEAAQLVGVTAKNSARWHSGELRLHAGRGAASARGDLPRAGRGATAHPVLDAERSA